MIAEIEAPDLDQQLLQARADLASQEANAKLSETTLTRRQSLIASNFVSMQEIDERSADLSNKKAAVNAGQANVERLEALAGYKKIIGAVRRRGDRARYRCRRADQCRRRLRARRCS